MSANSPESVQPIKFDACTCDSPAGDPVAYELPDGTNVEIIGCVNCGGAIEWTIEQPGPSRPKGDIEELRDQLKKERAKADHLKTELPDYGQQRKDPLENIQIDRLLTYLPESRNFITAPEVSPDVLVRARVAVSSSSTGKSHGRRLRTGRPSKPFHLIYNGLERGEVVEKLMCREERVDGPRSYKAVDATSYDLQDMRLCKDCLAKKLSMIDKRAIAKAVKRQAKDALNDGQ